MHISSRSARLFREQFILPIASFGSWKYARLNSAALPGSMYSQTVDQPTVGSQWVAVPDIGRIDQETSLALLPRLPSSALAAITHPIGAKAQPHALCVPRTPFVLIT